MVMLKQSGVSNQPTIKVSTPLCCVLSKQLRVQCVIEQDCKVKARDWQVAEEKCGLETSWRQLDWIGWWREISDCR